MTSGPFGVYLTGILDMAPHTDVMGLRPGDGSCAR